jgi:hypothetical protein
MVYTQEADQAAEFCFPDQLARIYIYYLSPKGISFRDYCNKKNWGITLEIPLAGFLSINFWHGSNQRFFWNDQKSILLSNARCLLDEFAPSDLKETFS